MSAVPPWVPPCDHLGLRGEGEYRLRLHKRTVRALTGKEESPAALGLLLLRGGVSALRHSNDNPQWIIVDWNHIRESLEDD